MSRWAVNGLAVLGAVAVAVAALFGAFVVALVVADEIDEDLHVHWALPVEPPEGWGD